MTTWSFRDALEELEARGRLDESVLRSALGLRLGDIHFAEIQTSIKMCAVCPSMFLRFVDEGAFNADNLALDGCSQTMAILLAFIPDRRLEDIESVGISNVIRRRGSPLGDISSINTVIESICSILDIERKKSDPKRRAYMMFIRNYGGHMAFATDPPYCVAYAANYKNNNPSKMTPCETLNHMYAMVTSNMMVRRLLSLLNWEPTDRKHTKGGRLLILRGMQFGPGLFPESHTAQPCGSAWRFSNTAGGPILDHRPLPSCRYYFLWPSRGSGIVHCWGSGQVEGVGAFKPSHCAWVSAALPTACTIQSW